MRGRRAVHSNPGFSSCHAAALAELGRVDEAEISRRPYIGAAAIIQHARVLRSPCPSDHVGQ